MLWRFIIQGYITLNDSICTSSSYWSFINYCTIFFFNHHSEANSRASDNSDMNPLMLAVEKGHLEVVKAMVKKDPGLVSMPVGFGSTMIHWALEEGHHRNAFFKVCFLLSYCLLGYFS